jgi:hypothetical protein
MVSGTDHQNSKDGRISVNIREEKPFRVINVGWIRVFRFLLLLVCLSAGGFLLLTWKRVSIGIILMLIALWLVLDNPFESFATLEGSCPSCGGEVRKRRCISFSCSACGKPIIVGPDSFYFVDDIAVAESYSRLRESLQKGVSQAEPIVISPGDTLDLHTFSPEEVPSLLDEFIHLSQEAEIGLVSIIHGKGTGALRRRARALLARDPRVVDFYDAPLKSGGWGATIAELKPATDRNNRKSSS